MSDAGSITVLLDRMKNGSSGDAVERLWRTYFTRLLGLARDRLRARPRGTADEEDVALSAFDSFVRAAQAGQFPRLEDRGDLWQVLLMLTSRKTADLVAKETAAKRGGGRVVALSALEAAGDQSAAGLDRADDQPNPLEAAALAEGFEEMLRALPAGDLRRIAVWKLEGFSNEEIGEKLGKAVATVERRLKTIRELFTAAGFAPAA